MSVWTGRSVKILAGIGLLALWGGEEAGQGVSPQRARARPGVSHGGGPIGASGAPRATASPWLDGELMASVRPGESLAEIARDHGTVLRRRLGPSGYGALVVPDGVEPAALRAELEADVRVARVDRVGRVAAAGSGSRSGSDCGSDHTGSDYSSSDDYGSDDSVSDRSGSYRAGSGDRTSGGDRGTSTTYSKDATGSSEARGVTSSLAWHLGAIDQPRSTPSTLKDVVVAVLDTGVAYETYSSGSVTYRAASSLSGSTFVSPYDFVNDDGHANDDHQHGTHVASLIASTGSFTGVAPGVSLMPVKVLDSHSQGSEVDLIDAIVYAVDHGADVINMSLSFSDGYVPSAALDEALQYAWDAGVVMVAAAGNDGGHHAHYPAASPLVISVGASTPASGGGLQVASYSDTGATVDLLAPGGDLSADRDGNGYADGVIGETFDPADPKRLGAWMFAGTSQAAALTSGAAARVLVAGASDPLDVQLALQAGAGEGFGVVSLDGGKGTGSLAVSGAMNEVGSLDALRVADEVSVAALPWLAPSASGASVAPMVKVTALDDAGEPLVGAGVLVSFWGSGGESISSCTTDSAGACTVTGPSAASKTSAGAAAPLAFAFGVDGVTWEDRVVFRPGGALFGSDALVVLAEALDAAGLLDSTILAWRWDSGTDADLGALAEAYMVVDAGAGVTSRPVGVVFTPEALGSDAEVTDLDVALDGTGLISDPLGFTSAKMVTLSGTGLISDPLGLYGAKLLVFNGAGLISDPLGFGPKDIYSSTSWSLFGAGLISDPLGFDSSRLSLSRSTSLSGASLEGTALGEQLDAGGWLTGDDLPGGSLLATAVSEGAVTHATSVSAE